jgi:hypothetical protein
MSHCTAAPLPGGLVAICFAARAAAQTATAALAPSADNTASGAQVACGILTKS